MATADLTKAIAEYAALDREVGELISARLSPVCASCEKPCCRADVCRQVVESWWLRQVSEHVHGKWWPDDWESRTDCIAMTADGCMLKAGRPAICRSFICDACTEAYGSLWDAGLLSFLADLPWEAGQVSSRVHVEELDEGRLPRYAGRIIERTAEARRLLDLAKGLLDEGKADRERHRILLELLCRVPRCFRATTRRALLARLTE